MYADIFLGSVNDAAIVMQSRTANRPYEGSGSFVGAMTPAKASTY
jgi:hypothetical protein